MIAVAVFTHWTVCHWPSFSAGPAISSRVPPDPTKPHEACPEGWYSTLYSPPAVVKSPLRMRSQSGVAGGLGGRRRVGIVRVAVPGFSGGADGTETNAEPLNANAVPANPGAPTVTAFSVPSWPPTASCMTVPAVSSMCQSATPPAGTGGAGGGGGGGGGAGAMGGGGGGA